MNTPATSLPTANGAQTRAMILRMLAADRWGSITVVFMFALAGVAGLVPPWVLGTLANDVAAGRDTVLSLSLFIAGSAVVGALFSGLASVVLARVGEPALATLREQVLRRAMHLPAARIAAVTPGDLVARLADDVRVVSDGMKGVVPVIANAIIALIFTVSGVLALDWRLGLAMLAAMPIYILSLRWYLPRARPLFAQQRISMGDRADALLTGINGSGTARAFGLGPSLLHQIDKTSTRSVDISISTFRLGTGFLNRNNLAELVGLATILGVGFFVMRDHGTTVGAVTAVALYFLRLFGPIGGLLFTLVRFQAMGAALSRLIGIAQLSEPVATNKRINPATVVGEVTLSGVGHEYVEGQPVLRGIDLRIAVGERVALVGATGAGKTTLGAIAAGVFPPTTGKVLLNGVPYDADMPATRNGVVRITQETHAFAGTVKEFLTLARPSASAEAVAFALTESHADQWVAALPEGLDTVVGGAGHQLTPDQIQHLALARVILSDPWFVVMDEATAEAGSLSARDLERAATAAVKGRTALVVAHRLTQAQIADRIIVMQDGEIVEEGNHDELLKLNGRYAVLWRAWSKNSSR